MIIPDDTLVTDVVTNFDLTFCQIWFDGENVLCTNKQHILDKHGKLNNDYLQSYVNGNHFIRKRINKYINRRGFLIDYGGCIQKTLTRDDVAGYRIHNKKVVSDEDWVAKKLYENLLWFMAISETERSFPQLVANAGVHGNRSRVVDKARTILLDFHLRYIVYFKDSFADFLITLNRAMEDYPALFHRVMQLDQATRIEHILVEMMYIHTQANLRFSREFLSKIKDILGLTEERLDEIIARNDVYFPLHYTDHIYDDRNWWYHSRFRVFR
jgi:hypothetical protein